MENETRKVEINGIVVTLDCLRDKVLNEDFIMDDVDIEQCSVWDPCDSKVSNFLTSLENKFKKEIEKDDYFTTLRVINIVCEKKALIATIKDYCFSFYNHTTGETFLYASIKNGKITFTPYEF